jgi:hypothetical protein
MAKISTFCRCATLPTKFSGRNPTFFLEYTLLKLKCYLISESETTVDAHTSHRPNEVHARSRDVDSRVERIGGGHLNGQTFRMSQCR